MATRGQSGYTYDDSSGTGPILSVLGDDPMSVTAGQAVLVGVAWRTNDATVTVTDSESAVYTAGTKYKHPGFNIWVQNFYCLNHPGSSDFQISAEWSVACTERSVCAVAYSFSTGAFIGEASGNVDGSATVTSGTIAASGSGVVFGTARVDGTANWGAGANTTIVRSAGFSTFVERLVASAGSYEVAVTDTAPDQMLLGAMLIQDEPAPGGGGGSTLPKIIQQMTDAGMPREQIEKEMLRMAVLGAVSTRIKDRRQFLAALGSLPLLTKL